MKKLQNIKNLLEYYKSLSVDVEDAYEFLFTTINEYKIIYF